MTRAIRLDRKGRLVVSESDVEDSIISILCWDGWRVFRFGWALTEAKREIGEVSSPDLLAVRYLHGSELECHGTRIVLKAPAAEVVWVEVKRLDGKASAAQKLWHDAERKSGGLVWVAGETFPATVEGFRDFYEKSNLKRRIR